MTIYEALVVMISFSTLMVSLIALTVSMSRKK